MKKAPRWRGFAGHAEGVARRGDHFLFCFSLSFAGALPLAGAAAGAAATGAAAAAAAAASGVTSSAIGAVTLAITGLGLPCVTTLMPSGSFRSLTVSVCPLLAR